MIIMYQRISYPQQNLTSQEELKEKYKVEKVYTDSCTNKNNDRPELERMIDFLREGDVVLVESINKLAFNVKDLLSIMEKINEDAKFRIKNSLVIDKVASLENLKVDPSDFDSKMESLSNMYQMDRETFTKYMLKNPGMINGLSQQVLNEKVMKFLSENNKVNFVKSK